MTNSAPEETNAVGARPPPTTVPSIPNRATLDVVVNGTQKSTVAIAIDVCTGCILAVHLCKPE